VFDFSFCFPLFPTVIQDGEAGLIGAIADCPDDAAGSEIDSVLGVKGNNKGTVLGWTVVV
jgi:hypothetical protein